MTTRQAISLWLGTTLLALIAFGIVASASRAQEAPLCLEITFRLTDKPDTFHATPGDDNAGGLRGADDLSGGGGNDYLNGGRDNDVIKGGSDHDLLCGGRGDDKIRGGSGNDLIYGEEESDDIDGGPGDDRILGSAASDSMLGGKGTDWVAGGGGLSIDSIDGAADYDYCIGGPHDFYTSCEEYPIEPKGLRGEGNKEFGVGEGGDRSQIHLAWLGSSGAVGRVESSAGCEGARKVRLQRYWYGFISNLEAVTHTDPSGGWSITQPLPSGLYFAQVDSRPGCRYDISRSKSF